MLHSKVFGKFIILGSLATTLAVPLTAESVQAAYSCGPHLATYEVRSRSGASGRGVRCVKWIVNNRDRSVLIWYGEGYWGNIKYRHIGENITSRVGSAADIHGNGEDAAGVFYRNLTIAPSRESVPRRVRITGGWNEEWILQGNGVVNNYTSTLPPVRTCGRNFRANSFIEYRVTDASGQRSGGGVRCYIAPAWYGEGTWNGASYAHIGFAGGQTGEAAAFDICDRSRFNICNFFPLGSITFNPAGSSTQIRGAWNENWTPVR